MKLINLNFILKAALSCLLLIGNCSIGWAQQKVLVVPIRQEIDPGMNRHVKLALEQAIQINADYVVIDMDTYGGMLKDADEIRTQLLEFKKPVYVFVNKNAASAGALISLACDKIYMAPGASIGAATVVNGDNGSRAPDKYQSYMRSLMRSTAQVNGYNPQIAEGMVDEKITVPGVNKPGQIVTLTSSEAVKHGFCSAEVNSVDELLRQSGIKNYHLVIFEQSPLERFVDFLLHPIVSGLLILIMIGGLIIEMKSPGIGLPIFSAIVAGLLYFIPHYLTGLAENWEIVIFVVGVILLAAEIFVIPGFGVAGVLGIGATFLGLVLVMLNNDWFNFDFVSVDSIARAIATALVGLISGFVLIIFFAQNITKTSFYKRAALHSVMNVKVGEELREFIGSRGIAYTVLRPGGKVMINQKVFDAYTRGNFIEKGAEVEVIAHEGTSLKVKQV